MFIKQQETYDPLFEDTIQNLDRLTEQESRLGTYDMHTHKNYIRLEDILHLSEELDIKALGEAASIICESKNIDTQQFRLLVNEETLIEDTYVRKLTKALLQEGVPIKIIPYQNKNMMIFFNEAISDSVLYNDNMLLEYCDLLLEGKIKYPKHILKRAKEYARKTKNKAVESIKNKINRNIKSPSKQQSSQKILPDGLPDPSTVDKISKSVEKQAEVTDSNNTGKESKFEESPSNDKSVNDLPSPDKVDKNIDHLLNNKSGSNGKEPSEDKNKESGPTLPEDKTPEPSLVNKPEKSKDPSVSNDIKDFNKEAEDLMNDKGDNSGTSETPSEQPSDKNNPESQNDEVPPPGNTDSTDTSENPSDQPEQNPPEEDPNEPTVDQAKAEQVQNAVNQITQQASQKPKNFIAKAIASLRKLYEKWLAEKQKAKDQGTIETIDNILRFIMQCIDKLLEKLQNFANSFSK